MKTLFEMITGDESVIVKIHDDHIRRRFSEMGLIRGTPIRVIRHAPLGDPVLVQVKGSQLAIRMNEAKIIEVE